MSFFRTSGVFSSNALATINLVGVVICVAGGTCARSKVDSARNAISVWTVFIVRFFISFSFSLSPDRRVGLREAALTHRQADSKVAKDRLNDASQQAAATPSPQLVRILWIRSQVHLMFRWSKSGKGRNIRLVMLGEKFVGIIPQIEKLRFAHSSVHDIVLDELPIAPASLLSCRASCAAIIYAIHYFSDCLFLAVENRFEAYPSFVSGTAMPERSHNVASTSSK